MKTIVLSVAVLATVAACASGPEASTGSSNGAGYEEKEAPRTGSNVSRRAPAAKGAPAAK